VSVVVVMMVVVVVMMNMLDVEAIETMPWVCDDDDDSTTTNLLGCA